MAIDTEIVDGNQELVFGTDDSGVCVFDTESSDGDHEGIRIETPEGARELARLLLLWADSVQPEKRETDQLRTRETEPQGGPSEVSGPDDETCPCGQRYGEYGHDH